MILIRMFIFIYRNRFTIHQKRNMLKGISPLISPNLLKILSSMGHGDEILLADAHFPGESFNKKIVRADGLKVTDLLFAIMPLFELDSYAKAPLVMMKEVKGDIIDPEVEKRYLNCIVPFCDKTPTIEKCDRFEFYERAKKAFAVVMTGETAKYGNIIIKKGIISQ